MAPHHRGYIESGVRALAALLSAPQLIAIKSKFLSLIFWWYLGYSETAVRRNWLRGWIIYRSCCWLIAAITLAEAAQANGSQCFSPESKLPEYIQIREMKLSAGTETYYTWRIHTNDRLEAGSWNNRGDLLEWSETPLVVPGLFDRVQQAASETSQFEPPDVRALFETPVSGRAGYSVSVSRTVNERTESIYLLDMPDSISKLVADLHALGVPMTAPAPGRYLWVEPDGRPADPARDLNGARACIMPWVRAMAQAIASGSLITPLNEGDSSHTAPLPLGQVLSLKARLGWYVLAHVEARR